MLPLYTSTVQRGYFFGWMSGVWSSTLLLGAARQQNNEK